MDEEPVPEALAQAEQTAEAKQRMLDEAVAAGESATSTTDQRRFIVIGDVGGTSSRLEVVAMSEPRGTRPTPAFSTLPFCSGRLTGLPS